MNNAPSILNISMTDLLAAMSSAEIGAYTGDDEDSKPITQRFVQPQVAPTLVVEAQTRPAPPPVMTVKPIVLTKREDTKPPKFTPKKVRGLVANTRQGTIEIHTRWIAKTIVENGSLYSVEERKALFYALEEVFAEQLELRSLTTTVVAKKLAKDVLHEYASVNTKDVPKTPSVPPPSSRPCIPPPSTRTSELQAAKKVSDQPKPLTAEEFKTYMAKISPDTVPQPKKEPKAKALKANGQLALPDLAEQVAQDQAREQRAAEARQRDADAKAKREATFAVDLKAGAMKVVVKEPSKKEDKKANKKNRGKQPRP